MAFSLHEKTSPRNVSRSPVKLQNNPKRSYADEIRPTASDAQNQASGNHLTASDDLSGQQGISSNFHSKPTFD
jgi:hypothetical protein